MATQALICYDPITGQMLSYTIPDNDWELFATNYFIDGQSRLLLPIDECISMNNEEKQSYIYAQTGIVPPPPPPLPDSPPEPSPAPSPEPQPDSPPQ